VTHFGLQVEEFFRDIAWCALGVAAFYIIGFIIESDGRIDDAPNRKGVLLNSLQVLVFHAADLSLGVLTLYYVKLLFDHVLHYKAPLHFGGGAFAVFALSCVAIAGQDFFYYWLHRLQHTSRWLWAEHELHHTEEHVNVTTSFRHHWLETVLLPLFVVTPLYFLLLNPALGPTIWIFLFSRSMGYFIHLNSPIRLGWFNRVLACPQSHRIHHSKSPEHLNKNFAAFFPFWDILFGTYHHPQPDEWPETGVDGVTVTSLGHAMVLPFLSWGKMLREPRRD
jgi:sterol desaturase/sphingolipid hydroxylase (fatty acid hydroxylase superfamily)